MQDETLTETLSLIDEETPLPKGWRLVRLGEICEIYQSQTISISQLSATGKYKVFGANGVIGFYGFYNHEDSEVLISCRGNCGTVNFSEPKSWITGNSMVIKPRNELLSKRFLYYILKAINFNNIISGSAQPQITRASLLPLEIPLPQKIEEQQRIASGLDEQMKAVEQAGLAVEAQIEAFNFLIVAFLRESIANGLSQKIKFKDFAVEVKKGVGETWEKFPVLGATRSGLALAKEPVGQKPERYKFVDSGTIFYNPMRILIGSIAMVDEDDNVGITSPDYVVFRGKEGVLHSRWLYHWLRSVYGENLIKSLARGAVRERILFNRLEDAEIDLPNWETQAKAAEQFKIITNTQKTLAQQLKAINLLPATLLRRAFADEL